MNTDFVDAIRTPGLIGLVALWLALPVWSDEPKAVDVDLADSRLVRALVGSSESRRIKAMGPLKRNRTARTAALDELLFALGDHIDHVKEGQPLANSTVELINLVASVDDSQANEALIEALACPHRDVVMCCADALGKRQCTDAIEPLKKLVEHEDWASHYGFRFNLIRSMALMDHADAYDFLAQVRFRIDGQLLHELNQIFRDVDLDDFLGDQQRFDDWKADATARPIASVAQTDNPDSMFKNASYSESADRIKMQRQKYYGIDIQAKRLLFIIDHSGSMKKGSTSNGRWATRLHHAKEALIQAIDLLPDDNEFGIMFYAEKVRQWKPGLVEATPENKLLAKQFVYRLGFGGSTNTYGALRESMDFDDNLEAVFLLTDGIPSSGKIVQPEWIIKDIVQRNGIRHLKINTIGIAVNHRTELFLKTLAKKCSGQFTRGD